VIILGIDVPGGVIGGFAVYDSRHDRMRRWGNIHAGKSEQDDYRQLAKILRRRGYDVIAIEHPFLYRIAQFIGGVKMWATLHDVDWYMITTSSAQKVVFGHALRERRQTPTGREVSGNKEYVLDWAREQYGDKDSPIDQHVADAMLYAVGVAGRVSEKTMSIKKRLTSKAR